MNISLAEQQFQSLVQSIDGIVWKCEPGTMRFLFVSDQVEQMLGYSPEQFVDNPEFWPSIIHADDRQRIIDHCRLQTKIGQNHQMEYRMFAADGREVWVRDVVTVIQSEGEPQSLVGVILDITAKKLAEERYRKLMLLEQREDFMACLAHDLKGPLAGASRLLEFLLEESIGPLNPEQKKALESLRSSSDSMLDLVEHLLDIYREEKQLPELRLEQVDLREVVAACVAEIAPLASSRGVSVEGRLSEVLPNQEVDRSSIRRVLNNLLENALAHSPAGGSITVTLDQSGQRLIFHVEDEGPGISPKEGKRIFERFYRGSSRRDGNKSFGLGLYVSKQIIEAHGGEIWFENLVPHGTRFSVSLPIQPGSAPP